MYNENGINKDFYDVNYVKANTPRLSYLLILSGEPIFTLVTFVPVIAHIFASQELLKLKSGT